jgi:hypothetical protein
MRHSNRPDLVLVVPSQTSSPCTWILEPQGRNTFTIVVVCRPKNRLEQVPQGSKPYFFERRPMASQEVSST